MSHFAHCYGLDLHVGGGANVSEADISYLLKLCGQVFSHMLRL